MIIEQIDQLNDFIISAKKNTYAHSDNQDEKINDDYSRTFIFKNGRYLYKDKYYGINPFSGQEVVFLDGRPIWTMNYYGLIYDKDIDEIKVYSFLRFALSQIDKDKPFRGIDYIKKDNYIYRNNSNGILTKFRGEENIYFNNKKIYTLTYMGGIISE